MPVNKTTDFESTHIELCRNCFGTGTVTSEQTHQHETCPVCDGKGRIQKRIKGTVCVESLE